ncbi:MAG: di-trans,poly-cis-decaprenylcistransferase [Chloroflexi bacterium]|nr:di-trans,poly-cis-decaprenylcistransferase [Chloroflexota bacterium]
MASISTVPQHVAIIMDGNGRWAKQRGLSRVEGHRAGTENIRRVIDAFAGRGVKYLTLYAFSTENWSRPRSEVNGLFRLLGQVIQRETRALHERGVHIRHLGTTDGLSSHLVRQVKEAVELTRHNTNITLSLAFNYGGRAEILGVVRRLIEEKAPPESIDEKLFASYLFTAGLPDPDLIIRTGGELRLSNFLLWQAAYSEYYATPTYWPDFDEEEIEDAIRAYSQRQRRFGGLVPTAKCKGGVAA